MAACDLCGVDCGKHPLTQRIADRDLSFCCLGCVNVYVILFESGAISSGQDIRQTELFQRSLALGLISQRDRKLDVPENMAPSGVSEELLLDVSGMWCSSCAWLIEHVLGKLPGVSSAQVSFASDTAKIDRKSTRLNSSHPSISYAVFC